jgi:hypothetical protein
MWHEYAAWVAVALSLIAVRWSTTVTRQVNAEFIKQRAELLDLRMRFQQIDAEHADALVGAEVAARSAKRVA